MVYEAYNLNVLRLPGPLGYATFGSILGDIEFFPLQSLRSLLNANLELKPSGPFRHRQMSVVVRAERNLSN